MKFQLSREVGRLGKVFIDGKKHFGVSVTYTKDVHPFSSRYPDLTWEEVIELLENGLPFGLWVSKRTMPRTDQFVFNVKGINVHLVTDTEIFRLSEFVVVEEKSLQGKGGFQITFEGLNASYIASIIHQKLKEGSEFATLTIWL